MINGNLALQPQSISTILNSLTTSPLSAAGWVKESLGQYRSNGQIKEKEGFQLYTRRRNLRTVIDDYTKKSSLNNRQNTPKNWGSATGSSIPMGVPEPKLTPSACDGVNCPGSSPEDARALPSLSSFSEYPSLTAARKDNPCLLIGYDSEWENLESGREMLSWQFSFVDGEDLVEFVFLKVGSKNDTSTAANGWTAILSRKLQMMCRKPA